MRTRSPTVSTDSAIGLPEAVLDRVRDQVRHHLFEPAAVPGTDDRCGDRPARSTNRPPPPARAAGPPPRASSSTMSTRSMRSANRPAVSRETSRRSSTRPPRRSAVVLEAARARVSFSACPSSAASRSPIRIAEPRRSLSAVSGVFSSCEAMEMNSSRARIAARRSDERSRQGQHADRRDGHVALHQQQALVRRLGAEDPVARTAPDIGDHRHQQERRGDAALLGNGAPPRSATAPSDRCRARFRESSARRSRDEKPSRSPARRAGPAPSPPTSETAVARAATCSPRRRGRGQSADRRESRPPTRPPRMRRTLRRSGRDREARRGGRTLR